MRSQASFHTAENYTPQLSAIVKMVQLLTIEYSVWTQATGKVEHAADTLQLVRSSCLLRTSHTPFAWVLSLRMWGRRIRNNMTAAGYLSWADDFSSLTFKDITFTVALFRGFLLRQIDTLQQELRDLCMLDTSTSNGSTASPTAGPQDPLNIPCFDLTSVKDNAANRANEWSFIEATELQAWSDWMLHRVSSTPHLQRRFFKAPVANGSQLQSIMWQTHHVHHYLANERRFLTRLALLTFILGGQPPRGTELFSLRYRNTLAGGPRNVFIDQGLISFVTSYHKGYSINGSLKLIHRFLPLNLSHTMVQYLVLIRPFVDQLQTLVFEQATASPFLWASHGQVLTTTHLSDFFAQESVRELGSSSKLTVASWRHIAIAVSREVLPKGEYFDREVNKNVTTMIDQQAGHSDLTAATTYGRLLEEGWGQIRQFRERYRQITKGWQNFWLAPAQDQQVRLDPDVPLDCAPQPGTDPESDPAPPVPPPVPGPVAGSARPAATAPNSPPAPMNDRSPLADESTTPNDDSVHATAVTPSQKRSPTGMLANHISNESMVERVLIAMQNSRQQFTQESTHWLQNHLNRQQELFEKQQQSILENILSPLLSPKRG